jgi:hypothetical protein
VKASEIDGLGQNSFRIFDTTKNLKGEENMYNIPDGVWPTMITPYTK